jgi:XrtJ-associated TM-motif-TM protein
LRKIHNFLPVVLLTLSATVRLHAQIEGCADSPENPTAVLGLIVGAAAYGYVRFRHRFAARNKNQRDRS